MTRKPGDERPRWHPRALNNGLIVGATWRGVARLPSWLTFGIGHTGTWVAYHLLRSGTSALIENLRGMFPDLPEQKLRDIALRTYRSYARDTIHFMRSVSMPPDALRAQVSRLDGAALQEALARGRGAIVVSPHFGNWELGAVLLRRVAAVPLSVVVMPEPSPAVGRLRTDLRTSVDIETIEVRQHLDTALRIRGQTSRNQVVAMLIDRHLDRDRVQVQFFGRPAFFLRTPGLMAYFTGAPLVPSFVYRDDDDRFVVECGPAIEVGRNGDRDENVQRATQQVAAVIEEQIRRRPHYWYQFYPFWSSQETVGQP
ncbi:MAG TPA: lysophospholipid acyltransferase family protein [Vicinamibacterales bacterium]|nr:lysophospholipid acyltransferase family protein [Vicinamibacterales bacterium]